MRARHLHVAGDGTSVKRRLQIDGTAKTDAAFDFKGFFFFQYLIFKLSRILYVYRVFL